MDEAMHKAIQVRAYFLWLEAQGHAPYAWSVLGAAELGLNTEVDESELARTSASEAPATQDDEAERPPAGEPFG